MDDNSKLPRHGSALRNLEHDEIEVECAGCGKLAIASVWRNGDTGRQWQEPPLCWLYDGGDGDSHEFACSVACADRISSSYCGDGDSNEQG